MRAYPFLAATAVLVLATQAAAQTKYPAVLEGHAVLPAMTLVPPPADAPQELQISGRYAGPGGLTTAMPPQVGLARLKAKRRVGIWSIIPRISGWLEEWAGESPRRPRGLRA